MLSQSQVETVFTRLRAAMPGRTTGAKGPKGQPDAFRSCISCMLSAQSLDRNTAKASRALFALATTPAAMLELDDRDIAAAIKPCGLYNNKTAQQIEDRAPDWAMRDGHFWLIQFGKRICTARAPKCDMCPVNDVCLWYAANRLPPAG